MFQITDKGRGAAMSHFAETITTTHLTPPHVIDAPEPRPWPTAQRMVALPDANGLMVRWSGRVWLNPPYSANEVGRWLERLASHDQGVALINATTETEAFQRFVLGAASGLFFIEGRLVFCDANGQPVRGKHGRPQDNPSPSVLCAYGQGDLDRLAACDLDGAFVPLRFARFALVAGLDQTWTDAIGGWLRRQHGPVSIGEAYRYFAAHPKSRANPNWRAKVRQKLQELGDRVDRATYAPKQLALI